jgi:hypothetical protein
MLRQTARGQSVVIVALVLPFLIGFTLLIVEVAERWLEVAMVEDALQQATRSAVQSFDYADLARGQQRLRASDDCHRVTASQESPCRELLQVARSFLLVNLQHIRGLVDPPATVADRVRWTVLPEGGTCSYSSGEVPPVTETAPLLCAEVRPTMRGVVGWGEFTPLVVAADTLDLVRE